MTELLQTDIDGSIDFSLNAITIQSLEKYLKTFYMPPLDIDQISSIWDQILPHPKTKDNVIEEDGKLQEKQQLFLFQSSRQCFISVLQNIDFLNQLGALTAVYLQVESIALDYKVFHGDQLKFSLNCLHCGKK